jgi:hypothetical protein
VSADQAGEQTGLSLEQLLGYVEQAVCGDRRLLVSLFRELQRLAHHPTAPPEERRLGEMLSLVLMGERQPDLSGLPQDMVDEITPWLEHLRECPGGEG